MTNYDENEAQIFLEQEQNFLQNTEKSGHIPSVKTVEWIEDICWKISNFLTMIETKYDMISNQNHRQSLIEILNRLYSRIQSCKKFSLIYF